MSIATVHAALSDAAIYFLIISGLWGLIGGLLRQPVTPMYRGILVLAELLLVAIALVGLVRLAGGGRPGTLHFLYAALSVLAFPGIFAFTRGGTGRRDALFYALASWVMVGFIIRAGETG